MHKNTYTQIQTHTYTNTHKHAHTHTHNLSHTHTHTHDDVHTYAHTRAHKYTRTRAQTHTYVWWHTFLLLNCFGIKFVLCNLYFTRFDFTKCLLFDNFALVVVTNGFVVITEYLNSLHFQYRWNSKTNKTIISNAPQTRFFYAKTCAVIKIFSADKFYSRKCAASRIFFIKHWWIFCPADAVRKSLFTNYGSESSFFNELMNSFIHLFIHPLVEVNSFIHEFSWIH